MAAGRRARSFAFAAAVVLLGCRSVAAPPDHDGGRAPNPPVRLELEPQAIPFNKDFGFRLVLDLAAFQTSIQSGAITVEALMPEHGHGMNVSPTVRPAGEPGVFLVERLLFHMRGKWRLLVHIQDGDRTVEATRDFEI